MSVFRSDMILLFPDQEAVEKTGSLTSRLVLKTEEFNGAIQAKYPTIYIIHSSGTIAAATLTAPREALTQKASTCRDLHARTVGLIGTIDIAVTSRVAAVIG